eukprot:CAMPEP_0197844994 /NCGR_PEP_ID=MMETSP1438-20131217/1956_1 /TAXON_ID=1461541 /ORGANISM="Pterosperma sp., Strain CCMP1384" /LENGTH=80 /DNA_ID=CAMNT_0043456053 /DNA_START=62 /DNA_END=304 /DNA_ORIENTATION=+
MSSKLPSLPPIDACADQSAPTKSTHGVKVEDAELDSLFSQLGVPRGSSLFDESKKHNTELDVPHPELKPAVVQPKTFGLN